MHTNPVSATNPIIPFSFPAAGVPQSSFDLYKMIGGINTDMAQQHTPPTRPSTAPKLGTLHARYAARETKPVRTARDTGRGASFFGLTTFSQIRSDERAMSGNVDHRLHARRPLTTRPATPVSMVTTTELTPRPYPTAPTSPNTSEMAIEMRKALFAALRKYFFSGIPSCTEKRVKWMKNRKATVPKKPENCETSASGIAASCSGLRRALIATQTIESATVVVPKSEMRFTPAMERCHAKETHTGRLYVSILAVVYVAACSAGSMEMQVSATKIM
mmetsp:Transcript_11930/g.51379  ORF Transcript_11930/g.51379 Transcript_11930/m.51379 type:complete len:275 (+) Transcript_11930:1252-2076(+)